MNKLKPAGAVLLGASLLPLYSFASSHREAPGIAGMPRLDGTDFYMFRSYEPGRSAYVTLIANYIPLQDAHGEQTPMPPILPGPITASGATLNAQQSYTVTLVRNGRSQAMTNQNTGA